MAHIGGGEFAGEIGEGLAELREFFQRGAADDGYGIVRREIVAIVFEGDEVERVDQTVSGVARDNVDLLIDQGAVEEAKVHDTGRGGEVEIVARAPSGEPVGAFEEFVADADVPLGGAGSELRHGTEMEFLRVVAAHNHGEGVFEAERFGDVQIETLGVLLFNAGIDGRGVVGVGGFVEDGG